jgi:hypothetical protein
MEKEWIIASDATEEPSGTEAVSSPNEAVKSPDGESILARRMRELSAGTGRTVMVRLPEQETDDPGSVGKRRVSEYFKNLRDHGIAVKFRKTATLLANHEWFWAEVEGRRVPYAAVRGLREAQREPKAPVFPLFANAMLAVTPLQLAQMAVDYPFAGPLANWQELFIASTRNRNVRTLMASERGCPISLLVQVMPDSPQKRSLLLGEIAAVRIVEKLDTTKPGWRSFKFEMLGADGNIVSGGGLAWSTIAGARPLSTVRTIGASR